MDTIADVVAFLEQLAPRELAEDWDNVGLLAGDLARPAGRIMTCLTLTPDTVAEAIGQEADLVVTHHPLPFRPVQRLTAETHAGGMLWSLASAGVSIYSAHTAFDSAHEGINQAWAEGIGLTGIEPLVPKPLAGEQVGAGRFGRLPDASTLRNVAERARQFTGIPHVQVVGSLTMPARLAAVACGSGAEFWSAAKQKGCHVLITGEARFHTCLEAEAAGIGLVLTGHYASERFGMERLAAVLAERFPQAHVWASRDEKDPIAWISS